AVVRLMIVAIDFHDHAGAQPGKVGDVWSNGCFPAKPSATGSQISQEIPHLSLGLGQFASERSGALSGLRIDIGMRHRTLHRERWFRIANPLWPAGHLPHKGGEDSRQRLAPD